MTDTQQEQLYEIADSIENHSYRDEVTADAQTISEWVTTIREIAAQMEESDE